MNVDGSTCRDLPDDREVEAVLDHDVSAPFDEFVDEYEARVGDRDRFLWKWLDLLLPEVTLSCVDADRRARARDAKLVATMFVVLLEDPDGPRAGLRVPVRRTVPRGAQRVRKLRRRVVDR